MPFERYLSAELEHHEDVQPSDYVQFQIPNFAFAAPTVAPGGGAEAFPAGLYPSPAWFTPPGWHSSSIPPPSSSSSSLGFPPPIPSSSSSSSFFSSYYSHPPPSLSFPPPPLSLPPSSLNGLPLYSSSGFDLLSILSRVAFRPHPKIVLGPVDMSCAFTIVDARYYDSPIVYASPSFCQLTGYDERDVIGQNCRFLQAPNGLVNKGDLRRFTSPDAVASLRKHLVANKECQVTLTNYRKDSSPFMNLITVIPIPEPDSDDVFWHIGFQVDVTHQPNAILQRLRDGSYIVNYSNLKEGTPTLGSIAGSRDWKANSAMMSAVSKSFRTVLADPLFIDSIPISTSTTASTPPAPAIDSPADSLAPTTSVTTLYDPYDGNKPLHMVLLEASPDFIHVLSLKGAFLYAAPAVRHVLGYEPDELVGKSLTDFAHKADIVPLMRELKESSTLLGSVGSSSASSSAHHHPSSLITSKAGSTLTPDLTSGVPHSLSQHSTKIVDLLFRMRHKSGAFVWVESRGRLHVEPGKCRKAIILCGRVREMPSLDWARVESAGGVRLPRTMAPEPMQDVPPASAPASAQGSGKDENSSCSGHQAGKEEDEGQEGPETDREMWGLVSGTGTFLFVGAAVRDVLNWGAGEVIGRPVADFVVPDGTGALHVLQEALHSLGHRQQQGGSGGAVVKDAAVSTTRSVQCKMERKDGERVAVEIVLYHVGSDLTLQMSPSPIVCQIRVCDDDPGGPMTSRPPSFASAVPVGTTQTQTQTQRIVHPLDESVFVEFDIARGSSWQYELQQLKFQNQRLADKVSALEASVKSKAQTLSSSRLFQHPLTVPAIPVAGDSTTGMNISGSLFGYQETAAHHRSSQPATWGVPLSNGSDNPTLPLMMPSSMSIRMPSLKRTWNKYEDSDSGLGGSTA